jgi:hypothetical protein
MSDFLVFLNLLFIFFDLWRYGAAFAKLHGSYGALDGGDVTDALVDLSGGAGRTLKLWEPAGRAALTPGGQTVHGVTNTGGDELHRVLTAK